MKCGSIWKDILAFMQLPVENRIAKKQHHPLFIRLGMAPQVDAPFMPGIKQAMVSETFARIFYALQIFSKRSRRFGANIGTGFEKGAKQGDGIYIWKRRAGVRHDEGAASVGTRESSIPH